MLGKSAFLEMKKTSSERSSEIRKMPRDEFLHLSFCHANSTPLRGSRPGEPERHHGMGDTTRGCRGGRESEMRIPLAFGSRVAPLSSFHIHYRILANGGRNSLSSASAPPYLGGVHFKLPQLQVVFNCFPKWCRPREERLEHCFLRSPGLGQHRDGPHGRCNPPSRRGVKKCSFSAKKIAFQKNGRRFF